MTDAKFTPGPWTVDQYGDVQANGDDVAMIPGYYGEETNAANARLIAAAPELLEALECVSTALADHEKRWAATLRVVRAAIAKATGAQA